MTDTNTEQRTGQDGKRPDYTRVQWVLLGLTIAVFALLISYQLVSSYRTVTQQEQQRLLTQSRVISSNMARQLEAANLAVKGIVNDLPDLMPSGDRSRLVLRLKALSDAMPGIRTMRVFDKNGVAIASSREELIGKNLSYRDFFQNPQKTNDPSLLYVSPPFKSILGPYILNLSRIVTGPDGTFNGVAVAALDPEYFDVLLSSVRYAPDMITSITL